MGRGEHECGICGREFEGYNVFVRDNFVEIVEWQRRKEFFNHLCEWCNEMYFELDWHGRREVASEYSDKDVPYANRESAEA